MARIRYKQQAGASEAEGGDQYGDGECDLGINSRYLVRIVSLGVLVM